MKDVGDFDKILMTYQCLFNHLIVFTITFVFFVHCHGCNALRYVNKHIWTTLWNVCVYTCMYVYI
jgi:hypothetical protein